MAKAKGWGVTGKRPWLPATRGGGSTVADGGGAERAPKSGQPPLRWPSRRHRRQCMGFRHSRTGCTKEQYVDMIRITRVRVPTSALSLRSTSLIVSCSWLSL
jgi:hypothetical protein